MASQGAQLSRLEEDLTRNSVERLQSEAALRSTAAALQQELELQREEHSSEVRTVGTQWSTETQPPTSLANDALCLHKTGTQAAIQLPV